MACLLGSLGFAAKYSMVAATDSSPGLQRQLVDLKRENGKLLEEIRSLREMRKGTDFQLPAAVYVTHAGTHFHIDPDCGSIKGRAHKTLRPCLLCSSQKK